MADISKTERLLNLVSFLLKSRRPVGIGEIIASVAGYDDSDVSVASIERRFERDKAALRDLGIPLSFVGTDTESGAGYVIPREAYFLPRIDLAPDEMAILAAAGRFAMGGAAGPVSDALRSALRKLEFDSPVPGDIRETAEERFLIHRRQETDRTDANEKNLRVLMGAVLPRRSVRFTYYAIGQDKVADRTVDPYGLGFSEGHWYLVGRDHDRDEVRVFRVDRIRGDVKRLRRGDAGPEYEIPARFRVQDHVGVPPWLFGEEEPTDVRLRFDAEVAFMVELSPAPGDRITKHKDGSMTLVRRASNLDSLLNWVLGFGAHVEALGPPEFRTRLVEALERLSALHAGPGGKGAGS